MKEFDPIKFLESLAQLGCYTSGIDIVPAILGKFNVTAFYGMSEHVTGKVEFYAIEESKVREISAYCRAHKPEPTI